MLTWVLLTALLSQTPASAEEADVAPRRELTATLELTGGPQLGASISVDYSIIPEQLYLNGGYTLLKTPAAAGFPSAITHIFFAGADYSVNRHLTLSGLLSASPKAVDSVTLDLGGTQVTANTSRSSLGGALNASWNSAGFSKLEWAVDGGLSATWNRLGTGIKIGTTSVESFGPLVVIRALLGLTLTFFDRTDVSLRGGISAYTSDPLTAGRFDAESLQLAARFPNAARILADAASSNEAAQFVSSQVGLVDSLSGYASAPLWVESKLSVVHRFNTRWSVRGAWAYNRYVPTTGFSNTLSTRVTMRLNPSWRFWVGASVQHYEPLDHRENRLQEPTPWVSGTGMLGAELTL